MRPFSDPLRVLRTAFSNRTPSSRQSSIRSFSKRCRRRLRAEPLEGRRLMAADFDGFRHNAFDAEDVNNDGEVSAVDALTIINAINRRDSFDSSMFTDVNNDGQRSALDALRVINRLNRGRDSFGRNDSPRDNDRNNNNDTNNETSIPELQDEVRSIDGTGNNLDDPLLGSAGQPLLRVADADYGDGISTPAGEDRPSAREISNALSDVVGEEVKSDEGLTAFIYVWGQFIDHDLSLNEQADGNESFDIEVPADDALFDPNGTGEEVISLTRSTVAEGTGTSEDNPAQQITLITSYLDGSQVYGSDQETADSLRTFSGGRMVVTEDDLLPLDELGQVIAGDIRASENIALAAMQTLFVREHNRLADEIAASDPDATDEEIYQRARAVVIAEIQAITYNEFLPALLGEGAIDSYEGYDSSVNPSIANEFSTAAYRFGHSTLNDDIEFFGNDGREVRDEIELRDAFFNGALLEETGIDSILKYDASSLSQEIDLEVVDGLRNFLFGEPGSGGFDLVALNIQRGRDHGLSDYNSTRVAYGLDPVESFADITSNVSLQEKLAGLYGDVNNIDLWVGLMAEDHVDGASVGELTGTIIADQFERTRDGDRFYYENVFSGADLKFINSTTLADVIERNTEVEGLQENVFFLNIEVSGQVTTTVANSSRSRGSDKRNDSRGGQSRGVEGVTVELLNGDGEVVDTTVTDSSGNYSFDDFPETGDYQIHVPYNGDTLDFLVSNGETQIEGLDFELRL
ncbi:peroxidase family protein [Aporhodopirellula aestuarii]|uniref:Dockerin type I domain-containing protein n=1 Tax=Aporhodopirellula aestuarii TaxID=2950107 RepID=A0ABT0TWJ2_9BACT|nr:peroxidase family protein [Aporhodopirellula aestuarii]MCM2369003.1 dockerin type I domain-containing protein [Aporhodopirellula aestuarii]